MLRDYTGNEIKKSEFFLLVEDYSKSTEDWKVESYEDGVYLGIYAQYSDEPDSLMIDEQIAICFPELEDLGIEDEVEGMMSYYSDDLSAEEMVEALIELGFKAIIQK